jgi:hypothetical protein
MEQLLSEKDLANLSQLVGNKFCYVAGPNLLHNLLDVSVYVVTDGSNLMLRGGTEELFLGEEWEDIFQLSTEKLSDSSLKEALDRGNVFVKHRGQVIKSIKVIQQDIRAELDSKIAFNCSVQSGILIEFDSTYLCISAQDLHIPLLEVIYLERLDDIQSLQPTNRFFQDIRNQVYVHTSLIEIQAKGS